jgi:hypothetical protein
VPFIALHATAPHAAPPTPAHALAASASPPAPRTPRNTPPPSAPGHASPSAVPPQSHSRTRLAAWQRARPVFGDVESVRKVFSTLHSNTLHTLHCATLHTALHSLFTCTLGSAHMCPLNAPSSTATRGPGGTGYELSAVMKAVGPVGTDTRIWRHNHSACKGMENLSTHTHTHIIYRSRKLILVAIPCSSPPRVACPTPLPSKSSQTHARPHTALPFGCHPTLRTRAHTQTITHILIHTHNSDTHSLIYPRSLSGSLATRTHLQLPLWSFPRETAGTPLRGRGNAYPPCDDGTHSPMCT